MDGGVLQLRKQLIDYTDSLFHEGTINDQFSQLQQLQDESNPNFVVEVVSLFFQDSERLINELANALRQPVIDFNKVDSNVHQLKGSSSSIGAQKVENACIMFRSFCEQQSVEGCVKCLQLLNREYVDVKSKLECLFKLEQQFMAAGGSFPM